MELFCEPRDCGGAKLTFIVSSFNEMNAFYSVFFSSEYYFTKKKWFWMYLTSGGARIAKNESKPSSASKPLASFGAINSFAPQA